MTPQRSAKAGTGALDIPVAFGGVLFQPGNVIYADSDGVVVAKEELTL